MTDEPTADELHSRIFDGLAASVGPTDSLVHDLRALDARCRAGDLPAEWRPSFDDLLRTTDDAGDDWPLAKRYGEIVDRAAALEAEVSRLEREAGDYLELRRLYDEKEAEVERLRDATYDECMQAVRVELEEFGDFVARTAWHAIKTLKRARAAEEGQSDG